MKIPTCERLALSGTSITMIVCVCNAIREDELRAAARNGAPNGRAAYKSLGCQLQCGTCLPCANEVIDDERDRMLSTDARAA